MGCAPPRGAAAARPPPPPWLLRVAAAGVAASVQARPTVSALAAPLSAGPTSAAARMAAAWVAVVGRRGVGGDRGWVAPARQG